MEDGKRFKVSDENEDKETHIVLTKKSGDVPGLLGRHLSNSVPEGSVDNADGSASKIVTNEIMDDLINTGLFVGESLPKATRRRAWELLHRLRDVAGNEEEEQETLKQQLFEIFIQQEEYQKFSKNFASLENLFGVRQESNPLHWSNFRIEDDEDMSKLYVKSKVVRDDVDEDEDEFNAASSDVARDFTTVTSAGKTVIEVNDNVDFDEFMETHVFPSCEEVAQDQSTNGDADDPVSMDENEDSGSELQSESSSEEKGDEYDGSDGTEDDGTDRMELIDKEGRLWSGCIIDNDMVQHTLPGGRVASHRALVAVGNGRGSGGYGIGKGSSPVVAVNNAFRFILIFSSCFWVCLVL
jgi:hypothetical protein